MSRKQIITHKLRLLQDSLIDIAADIDNCGGSSAELQDIKKRLLLQASQAEMWADNIEQEQS